MRRIHATFAVAAALVLGALAVSVAPARAWVRENFRDQGRSNLNLRVPAGRLAFELERSGSSKIHDGSEFDAIRAAFRTLSSVDGTSVQISDAGMCDLAAPIHSRDGLKQDSHNRIYFFQQHDATFGALAYTGFFYNVTSGEIVEADTALNEADFTFTTRTPGDANEFLGNDTADLREVVTHEIMHALGFDHSAVAGRFDVQTGREVAGWTSHDYSGQSSIYPIASQTIQGRSLSEDDVAGLRAVYGSGTATFSGRVVDGATGRALKGVHVVAVRPEAPDMPVAGTITGTGDASGPGEFVLAGLSPGSYYLRIEPLGGGTNPFVGVWTNYTGFQTSFDPEFYSGTAESAKDETVGMADAAMMTARSDARIGSIVIVTNSTPAPLAITSAQYHGGKLKVVGTSFPVGSTVFEVNGVRFTNAKFGAGSAPGTMSSKFTSKDPSLASMMTPGVDARLVVVDVTTGERSASVAVTH